MAEGLRFELVPMRQLSEALYDDDDWTGMKDPAERRKRQIRLSLRAYRASSRQGQGIHMVQHRMMLTCSQVSEEQHATTYRCQTRK